MSKFDLPELPSDDELGITDEDRDFYAKELGDDRPEMSDAEMRALLGDAVRAPAGGKGAKPAPGEKRKAKEAAKAAKKAEKERKKAERARLKAEQAAAKQGGKAAGAAPGKRGAASEPDEQQRRLEAIRAGAAGPAPGTKTKPPAADPPPPPKGGAEPPPATAESPRSRWRGAATLAALIVIAFASSSRIGLPRPVPANAPDTAFSSSRAMSTLIEIAREAHPTGSPEHTRVRELLLDRLRALGLEPEVQTTTFLAQSPQRAHAATVRNVVARLPGTASTGAVLLMAHYDSRGISRGAGDDGSGVATILETVRAVRAGAPLRNDLIVLLTDAEELGLLGARAFVEDHPAMADVSIVLSFEMRGSAGPSIMFETGEEYGWVVRALASFDTEPFANSMSYEVYRRMPNDTDFTPFREAGKQGLNFAAIGNAHVYHQEYDVPEDVSESTLQHHGVHALGAARHFGGADLAVVDGPNVVYFTLPLIGMVVYPSTFVLPVSGLVLLLLVSAFFSARRGGARPGRMVLGLAITLAGAGLVFGAAWALGGWLPRFHPEAGSLHGSTYHAEGWYVVALGAMVFTLVTAVHALARRWLSATELALGAATVPALLAIALGFSAPVAAMNLQWPVIAALSAITLVGLLGERGDRIVGWIAAMLLAVPVIAFLLPVTETVWLALRLGTGTTVALLITATVYLCLPALDALRHPNSWWAPSVGVVGAAAALGLGLLGSRPGPERPLPSTLVYAYEHGTGSAVWATDPGADSLDAEAAAWAVERAGGSFDGTRDLSGFAYPAGQTPTVTAPVVSAQPPEVVIARDTIDGPTRRVTLNVRSRIGAEMLGFVHDGRGTTRILSIDGEPIQDPASLELLEHWGQPDGHVVLELEMGAQDPIGIHVIEHLLRPEELLGPGAFVRPPRLAPDITRMSDRAMFRYSVAVFVDPRYAIRMPAAAGTAPSPAAPAEGGEESPAASDSAVVQPDTGAAPGPPPAAPPDSAPPRDTLTVAPPRDTVSVAPPRDTLAVAVDTVGGGPFSRR